MCAQKGVIILYAKENIFFEIKDETLLTEDKINTNNSELPTQKKPTSVLDERYFSNCFENEGACKRNVIAQNCTSVLGASYFSNFTVI